MKYEFTDRVRKALAMAREESLRHGHDYVGTEHMLLGALRVSDPEVTSLLAERGTSAEELRGAVVGRMKPGTSRLEPTELPYTSRAKRVLQLAMQAARAKQGGDARRRGRGRDSPVGMMELLAGLLGEERGVAAAVLREAGITPAALGGGAGEEEAVSPRLEVAIDDASDRSIYEQIVRQIQERIAVGEVGPGERLPTVRRLADRLDIAPGTVARAYSELERLGLVVTQGARGTRVAERQPSRSPDGERGETLVGLLRPVAVAAFHLGARADELRGALERAMEGIFGDEPEGGAASS